MLARALPDLNESDLKQLVTNAVCERRDLEFKRDWPGNGDEDRKEFLADVSSLANAQGGDVLFGIEDLNGTATAVVGLDSKDSDGSILRLENILRDGVEPRLSVRMQWVPLVNGRGVLVLRVPGSLVAPHRVVFKNSNRFFSRNSRGKFEMDVDELRHAFTQSEEIPKQLRGMHFEVQNLANGSNMPYALEDSPFATVSVVPLGFARNRLDLELSPKDTMLPFDRGGGFSWMHSLEGMLWHSAADGKGRIKAFALTYRSGRIDSAFVIGGVRELRPGKETKLVWTDEFERGVADAAVNGTARLRSYGIEGPWVVMVSVHRVKGFQISPSQGFLSRESWRHSAELSQLILDNVTSLNLLPIFKAFWLLFSEKRPD